MNTDILIDFCKHLMKSSRRKVYLILDNLRAHHAKVFKVELRWLSSHFFSVAGAGQMANNFFPAVVAAINDGATAMPPSTRH